MTDIERLSRELTFDEYNIGKELFSAMKDEGIASAKAAAMCYRAGYRQAIADHRQRRNRYHTERLERERLAQEAENDASVDTTKTPKLPENGGNTDGQPS